MNKQILSTSLTIGATLILAACSTTPKTEAPAAPAPVAAAPAPAPMAKPVVAPVVQVDPLNDPNSILAKRSVYFDFDKYTVKPEFAAMNQAHAKYLMEHSSRTIVLQGNTDSRGTREYNLALGQKRAEAERKTLEALGVAASRMESVSFGKEKPKAMGENEAAWAENRRADIVYK